MDEFVFFPSSEISFISNLVFGVNNSKKERNSVLMLLHGVGKIRTAPVSQTEKLSNKIPNLLLIGNVFSILLSLRNRQFLLMFLKISELDFDS